MTLKLFQHYGHGLLFWRSRQENWFFHSRDKSKKKLSCVKCVQVLWKSFQSESDLFFRVCVCVAFQFIAQCKMEAVSLEPQTHYDYSVPEIHEQVRPKKTGKTMMHSGIFGGPTTYERPCNLKSIERNRWAFSSATVCVCVCACVCNFVNISWWIKNKS